jgi:hypothetical protein
MTATKLATKSTTKLATWAAPVTLVTTSATRAMANKWDMGSPWVTLVAVLATKVVVADQATHTRSERIDGHDGEEHDDDEGEEEDEQEDEQEGEEDDELKGEGEGDDKAEEGSEQQWHDQVDQT